MANFNLSSNMSLPIPIVGVDPGPDWASNINSSLTLIDGHDHSPGYGTPVTTSGMSINADLTMASNNLTFVRSVRLNSQSAVIIQATDLNCLYDVLGDLYFNDGSGNQVRITQSGGVVGTPGSISTLTSPASATYNAGSTTFVWQSDANKAAAMDGGAVIIRETNVTSANGVTLQSPTSLAASYTFTLPSALPASTQYLTSTSGGVLSTATADSIGAAMTATGANAIGVSMTSTGANAVGASMTSTGANAIQVSSTRSTGTSVGTGGVAISTSSGVYTFTTSVAQVTNLSVTIITSGRPVRLALIAGSASASSSGILKMQSSTTTASSPTVYFRRASSDLAKHTMTTNTANANTTIVQIPASAFEFIDVVAAGTYTYTVFASIAATTGGAAASFDEVKLVAYEL